MKIILVILFLVNINNLISQTEIQKFNKSFEDSIVYSKKQAAFNGKVLTSELTVIQLNQIISSFEEQQVETFIKNYKNTSPSSTLNNNEVSLLSTKVPLSAFNTFPLHVQQYIVSKKEYYSTYINFQ